MIDKRSLLLGLGIGLVAGALALQLMQAGREQNERLAELGRLAGEEALYTQSEVDEMIAEAEERIRRELARESPDGRPEEAEAGNPSPEGAAFGADAGREDAVPEDTAGGSTEGGERPEADGGDAGTAEAASETASEAAADGAAETAIRVRIRPGMTLTQTARLLESEGVIEDADALIERMARKSTKIRAGYYNFTGRETLEEVQTIITSPPAE